jgi:hypothetical protein
MVFVFDLDLPDHSRPAFDQRKLRDALLHSTDPTTINGEAHEDQQSTPETRLNINDFAQALACYP